MMRRPDHEEQPDPQHYVGMILVGIGSLALLYIVVSVMQMIRNPTGAGLINWVMKTVAGKQAVLGGTSGGETFEIHASEAFQYMFLCLIGLIILRLLTSIFISFVKQGTDMMVQASKRQQEREAHERMLESKKPPTPPR